MKPTLQSVMKEARKNFPVRNDCTGVINKHSEYCQGCIEIMIIEPDELENFLAVSFASLLHSEMEGIIGEDERERKYITDLAIKDDFEGVKGLIKNQLRASQRAKLNEKVELIKSFNK